MAGETVGRFVLVIARAFAFHACKPNGVDLRSLCEALGVEWTKRSVVELVRQVQGLIGARFVNQSRGVLLQNNDKKDS